MQEGNKSLGMLKNVQFGHQVFTLNQRRFSPEGTRIFGFC